MEDLEREVVQLWEQIDSYTADAIMDMNAAVSIAHMAITAKGPFEYKKKDDDGLFRMELNGTASIKIPLFNKDLDHHSLTVFDGEYRWTETTMMGKKTVNKVKAEDVQSNDYESGPQMIKRLKEKGEIKRLPDRDVQGVPCYGIEVKLNAEQRAKGKDMVDTMRIYLAKDSGITIKMGAYMNDQPIMTVVYLNVALNPKIDPARFVYTPPPGVEVTEGPRTGNYGQQSQ